MSSERDKLLAFTWNPRPKGELTSHVAGILYPLQAHHRHLNMSASDKIANKLKVIAVSSKDLFYKICV